MPQRTCSSSSNSKHIFLLSFHIFYEIWPLNIIYINGLYKNIYFGGFFSNANYESRTEGANSSSEGLWVQMTIRLQLATNQACLTTTKIITTTKEQEQLPLFIKEQQNQLRAKIIKSCLWAIAPKAAAAVSAAASVAAVEHKSQECSRRQQRRRCRCRCRCRWALQAAKIQSTKHAAK